MKQVFLKQNVLGFWMIKIKSLHHESVIDMNICFQRRVQVMSQFNYLFLEILFKDPGEGFLLGLYDLK